MILNPLFNWSKQIVQKSILISVLFTTTYYGYTNSIFYTKIDSSINTSSFDKIKFGFTYSGITILYRPNGSYESKYFYIKNYQLYSQSNVYNNFWIGLSANINTYYAISITQGYLFNRSQALSLFASYKVFSIKKRLPLFINVSIDRVDYYKHDVDSNNVSLLERRKFFIPCVGANFNFSIKKLHAIPVIKNMQGVVYLRAPIFTSSNQNGYEKLTAQIGFCYNLGRSIKRKK